MASAAVISNLNVESNQVEERRSHFLEPKSFEAIVEENLTEATDIPKSSLAGVNRENDGNGWNKEELAKGDMKAYGYPTPALTTRDTPGTGQPLSGFEDRNKGLDGSQCPMNISEPEVPTNAWGSNEKEESMAEPQIECRETRHEHLATCLDRSLQTPSDYRFKGSLSMKAGDAKTSSADIEFGATGFGNPRNVTEKENLINASQSIDYREGQQRHCKKAPKEDSDRTLVSGHQAGKSWHHRRVRFAPWNVPLKRRLQTLVVLFHSTCIALSVSVFFFLCAIPIFWPLLIPYMIYCMSSKAATSGTLTRRSKFLRRSPIWSLFASYYPAKLHRTHELPSTRKYIFGYHPHGIISHGAWAAFATEALGFSQLFPDITNTLLTLDSNFRIPIYRDYILAMGLASVSRESCENLLSRGGKNGEGMGRGITIVIGGAAESLDAQPYTMRLILKRRKGFIKMALRTGADLVPVLAFGENDLYDQFSSDSHPTIHKAQLLLKKLLGFTIPLFHARGIFNYDVGLMPYRRPLNIVVGRPIKVTQSARPSQDDIDRLHGEYIDELQSLWDKWKDDFAADRQGELQICE